jgi:hypothetical protein
MPRPSHPNSTRNTVHLLDAATPGLNHLTLGPPRAALPRSMSRTVLPLARLELAVRVAEVPLRRSQAQRLLLNNGSAKAPNHYVVDYHHSRKLKFGRVFERHLSRRMILSYCRWGRRIESLFLLLYQTRVPQFRS